jgi:Flp pilus assembly protein TadD
LHRGALYYNTGDHTKALADLNKAIELVHDNAQALYLRGIVRQKTGDSQGGEVDIAAAQKIDPKIQSSVQQSVQ